MQIHTAFSGGLLYVEGSHIFVQHEDESPQRLITLDPGFQVRQISVNSERSMLAAASKSRVETWILEGSMTSARKTTNSGETNLTFTSDIISIKWHPCARNDSGLVILTTTELISAYLPPGQPIVLEVTELKDTMNLALDPVNFSFGADDSPLGGLTLYFNTVDGDIYKLFPYTVPEIELDLDTASTFRQHVDTTDWQSANMSWSNRKRAKVEILKRPIDPLARSIIDREPVYLSPYPEEFYDETDLDLSVGSIGWNTDIVVQSTVHYVNFYASSLDPASDNLVLVASVKFARGEQNRTIGIINPHWTFVQTDTAVHALDISSWSSQLLNASLSGSDSSLMKSQTKVSMHPLSMLYPTGTQTVRAVGSDQEWMLQSSWNSDANSSSPGGVAPSRASVPITEYLDLRLSALTASTASEVLSSIPDAPILPKWGANLASLESLNAASRAYNKKIITLAKLIARTQRERQAQRRESTRLIAEAEKLENKSASLKQSRDELKGKLARATSRQTELSTRLRKVRDQVAQLDKKKPNNLPGQAEETWFNELKKTLPRKLDEAGRETDQLKQSLAALKIAASKNNTSRDSERMDPGQLLELNWRLKKQTEVITSLKSRLE